MESGLVDVFESNRRAMRQRLHAQVRHAWKRHQLVVDYEFTRSRDNTDGPFSFLEQPGNLAAEWARSAGVSPHNFTVMSTVTLPAAISLNVVDTWRSRAPFNITTALDTATALSSIAADGQETAATALGSIRCRSSAPAHCMV